MRPSWPTATSGRTGPTRRRGSASARGRVPLETPVVAGSEPAGETPKVRVRAVANPEATAVRGPSRWDETTVARLSKLVVELEWALLDEALPRREEFDPLTAAPEELKAYLARHPRLGRSPPR